MYIQTCTVYVVLIVQMCGIISTFSETTEAEKFDMVLDLISGLSPL